MLITQWIIVIVSSLVLFWIAPRARSSDAFFRGREADREPGQWLLMSSLVISWLFAKSITNAANLGLSFGIVGGVAYAAYYCSFLVAGWIIYRLRTRGGFASIHAFLGRRFGRGAIAVFSLLIGFRLFNEVWSNTMVIGTYFGDMGSVGYYAAILVFTALTLAYSLKGGMSSSLLTDLIQMVLFAVLLSVILLWILPRSNWDVGGYLTSGNWTLDQGVNLLLVALIQSLSYPWHDPILTDRGFISGAKTTLRAYLWAAPLGMVCIVLFSFVGIYGRQAGVEGQAPVEVAKLLGVGMMLVMNFIMITSAASTLDSTFSSFAKLGTLDLRPNNTADPKTGRRAMVLIAVLGTLPVFLNPTILSATTVSGTMVIGLAPVFLCWRVRVPKISFFLAVGGGLVLGVVYALGWLPAAWQFSQGPHADLLAVNLWGTLLCFALFLTPRLFIRDVATNV